MREYQTVAVDPEDIEDGIRDARLLALRKEGYSTVAVLTVEQKGKVRLAFLLEPPTAQEAETRIMPAIHPWIPTLVSVLVSLGAIAAVLLR